MAKWAGLDLEGKGQERRECLLSDLKELVEEGGLALEGAESTTGGKARERGVEAWPLHLVDLGFISQRMWDLAWFI